VRKVPLRWHRLVFRSQLSTELGSGVNFIDDPDVPKTIFAARKKAHERYSPNMHADKMAIAPFVLSEEREI
ncbi:MAG: hypothetical protein ABI999_15430, partial [Acidobacteriota bacterium]